MDFLNSVSKSRPGNIKWHGQHSFKQPFNLPDSIIYYFTKNPSNSKCYSKIIQSCKYFFETNPIIIAENVYRDIMCYEHQYTLNCFWNPNVRTGKCLCKIWILNRLEISEKPGQNAAALLCSKLYRIEIKLFTASHIKINFDDFKILTSTVTDVRLLYNVKIVCNNEKTVMLEQIIEAVPNIKILQYNFTDGLSMISNSTIKNILQLKHFKNMEKIFLINISEIFSVKDLSTLIKDNKKTLFNVSFHDNIPEAYKNELDAMIDIIIQSEIPGRLISYDGMSSEKRRILCHKYYAVLTI